MESLSNLYSLSGTFTLSLRFVVGWTYFSAFWRRLILDNKLDPQMAGYIGEKFNHFLPNALGIKPLIEYLVSNPSLLYWAMVIFTLIEATVGLFIMLGFMTRLMSIGVFLLATGILLGAGWLGTTCLDEWQIGILGMASGFTLFFTGGGKYALDSYLQNRFPVVQTPLFNWLGSGELSLSGNTLQHIVIAGTLFIAFTTLFTNQYFHHGVWGKLHNKSVKPMVQISNPKLTGDQLSFTVYRVEGVDVYGSFLIGLQLKNETGKTILEKDAKALSEIPHKDIDNEYIAKVKPGKYSLVIPLGGKARITLKDPQLANLRKGTYKLILTDISGIQWSKNINY